MDKPIGGFWKRGERMDGEREERKEKGKEKRKQEKKSIAKFSIQVIIYK
jgi:hypothetical protein